MAKPKDEIKLKIKEDLKELSDVKYRDFHSKLCPGTTNILGVRVPVLRKYAKEFFKKYSEVSYDEIDNEYYEEILLQGLLIGFKSSKDTYQTNLEAIKEFIPKIDNWAICDIFVSSLKVISKTPDNYWEFVKQYSKKSKEFEKRFAYVTMLSYYINDKYIDEVLALLVNEDSEDYYVYMAVAWALSVCLVKYYNKTLQVMKISNLNKITYNKAIQKARESYRITEEQKEALRKLKK